MRVTNSVQIINYISFAIISERSQENKHAILLTSPKHFLYFAILLTILWNRVETELSTQKVFSNNAQLSFQKHVQRVDKIYECCERIASYQLRF